MVQRIRQLRYVHSQLAAHGFGCGNIQFWICLQQYFHAVKKMFGFGALRQKSRLGKTGGRQKENYAKPYNGFSKLRHDCVLVSFNSKHAKLPDKKYIHR
jgi:hypothetical protein